MVPIIFYLWKDLGFNVKNCRDAYVGILERAADRTSGCTRTTEIYIGLFW